MARSDPRPHYGDGVTGYQRRHTPQRCDACWNRWADRWHWRYWQTRTTTTTTNPGGIKWVGRLAWRRQP